MSEKATCPFCGSTAGLTEEHIWPDWLSRALPSTRKIEHRTQWGETRDFSGQRGFQRKPYREKARCACHACNTGWMSRVEEATKPLLLPMLNGEQVELDESRQRTLARFAILKALAWEYSEVGMRAGHPRVAPDEHYQALYKTRDTLAIPKGIDVWTARYSGNRISIAERRTVIHTIVPVDPVTGEDVSALQMEVTVYLTIWTLHQLVLHVVGRPSDLPFSLTRGPGPSIASSVRRIAPPEPTLVWPPDPPLTTARLYGIIRNA